MDDHAHAAVPNDATGSSFFQKRVGDGAPDWLQTDIVSTPNGTTSRAGRRGLAHVAGREPQRLGFHVGDRGPDPPTHADDSHRPRPQPGVVFDDLRAAARHVKPLLDEVGVGDIRRPRGIAGSMSISAWNGRTDQRADRRGRIARNSPASPRRGHRCLVEEERGERYSSTSTRLPHRRVRALSDPAPKGPQVSAPFTWDQLDAIVPDGLTIQTVPERVAANGDPWSDIKSPRQSSEPFLDMSARDFDNGLIDAPRPTVYPKMPVEPPRRRARAARQEGNEVRRSSGGRMDLLHPRLAVRRTSRRR